MARYFFDIHGRDVFLDDDGELLDSDEVAGRNAVQIASEMLPNMTADLWNGTPLAIDVRTEGTILGTVTVSATHRRD